MSEQSAEIHPYVLYSRVECHLCDVAAAMLDELKLSYQKQDIEMDLALITRYGTRIPVLYRNDTNDELDWPFSEEQVRQFFEAEQ